MPFYFEYLKSHHRYYKSTRKIPTLWNVKTANW